MSDKAIRKELFKKKKELQTRKNQLESQKEELEIQNTEIRKTIPELNSEIIKINKELQKLDPKKIGVSDHAILRYLERSEGFDIAHLREQLEEAFFECPVLNGKFPINGVTAIVQGGTIVTFVPQTNERT